MTIIKSNDEWDKFYYYSHHGYKPKKYPKSYPCIAKKETEGGGLMGEYTAHYVLYLPENLKSKKDAFFAGVAAAEGNWKRVG